MPFRVTFTAPAYQPLSSGCATSTLVVGAVRSILIPSTVTVRTLPALSFTDAVAERLLPSPSTSLTAGASPARPESSSEAVHATVTSPRYQPLSFGSAVALPESTGAVLSTLMALTPSVALLPAASTASPLADWSLPSPSVLGTGQVSTPESASPQAKLTVTSSSYQPPSFASRSAEALIVGAVRSIDTVAG